MESAALVAIVLSNGPEPWLCNVYPNGTVIDPTCLTAVQDPDWEDFLGIILLLVVNATIGYYEESTAGAAVSALMDKLARLYKVKRNGAWTETESKNLVPGDIITIKLGDVIPADCKLLKGEPLKVDQSALTGESLPVEKFPGDTVLSGSTVKQGEIEAMVYETGVNTESGKAMNLVQTTDEMGHLQTVLRQIGFFCVGYILIWIVTLCAVLYGGYRWDYRRGIDMLLVILIGGVPIAMPTVLSVTMAIGVNELAKEQAIVTRITAVEELAGMDILCSDKTGTLTQNKLTVRDPTCHGSYTAEDILEVAALASRLEGNPDAIDRCIKDCLSEEMEKKLFERYEVEKFIPFNPDSKRTEAHIRDKTTGNVFLCSKGAPQVIINKAHDADKIRPEQNKLIQDYASRGLRALGVMRSDDGGETWDYMGLISLFDPPRVDSKETIQTAISMGVRVIMITGDQLAIGKETARELGMGLNFHAADVLKKQFVEGIPLTQIIEESDGWAEVMPEDKYRIVKGLSAQHHIVGMTGDGVNDAAALKVADVGIAVAGATDAARGAADMVLLREGLSVIIKAIIGSRCIFQRMRSYSTYACCTTIRIVTTFSLLACIWQFSYPPFLVLIIALLNDGTIMTVSTDRVHPSMRPDAWRLPEIFVIAFVLGLYLTLSSLIFFYLIVETTFFEEKFGARALKYNNSFPQSDVAFELNGVMYLQVSITGQLVLLFTRSPGWFFLSRPSVFLGTAFIVAQIVATLVAVYSSAIWTQLLPIGWGWAAIVWVWSIIWLLPLDLPKFLTQFIFEGGFSRFRNGFEEFYARSIKSKGLGGKKKARRDS